MRARRSPLCIADSRPHPNILRFPKRLVSTFDIASRPDIIPTNTRNYARSSASAVRTLTPLTRSLSLGLKATPFLGTATFRLTRPTPLIAHCLGDIVPAAGARTPVWNVLIRAKVSLLFKNTSSLKPPFSSCSYGVMVYDG